MSKKWKTYKLGDIAKLRKEGIKPSEFNSEKYIGLEHIGQGNFLLDSIGDASDVTSNKSKFWEGDILYGKIRPYFKKVYRPKFSGICSTDMLIFNTQDESLVTQSYLHQFIKTQEFTDKATETSTGTKMPRADWNSLKLWEIQLPPLPEQKAIANILSAIDDKIENNLAINKTLEDMAMALYKHWFVDFGPFQDGEFVDSELGPIPEGWEVKRLEDLIEVISGYAFKSKWFQDFGEKVVKIKNISNNVVDINNCNCITAEKALEINDKFKIEPGDFLVAMTGAEVGKVGVVPDYQQPLWLNQRVGKLEDKLFLNSSILVGKILQSKEYYEVIQGLAYGSAQPNISASGIENIEISLPNNIEDIQDLINELVNLHNQIIHNLTENQNLTKLRDTLLPKLISGEVRLKEYCERGTNEAIS
ncbi:restriction endonuclease subunit S [Psychroflexus salinarum]|uniref:Restriction endonuclease subunit S n=1 Tax=Psychroflexus salinarum TaxID=546024 RepID=A0ABW3GLQ0_9FLAO